MVKRIFDLCFAILGLVLLAPLLIALALAVKLSSPGPVFFRQERVGRYGQIFRIHKFRTMVVDAERSGLQITISGDSRITKAGRVMRKYKLDELGQLIDVVQGTMSLVGPRPEVPQYVCHYPPGLRSMVLSVRPGITDSASIEYREESSILARSADPHRTYVDEILPQKLEHYVAYARAHSVLGDIRIIVRTIVALLAPRLARRYRGHSG